MEKILSNTSVEGTQLIISDKCGIVSEIVLNMESIMTLVLLVLVALAVATVIVRVYVTPAYIMHQNAEEVAFLAQHGREMEPEPTHLWLATFIIMAIIFSAFMAVTSVGLMVLEGTLIPMSWAELLDPDYVMVLFYISGFMYCVWKGRRIKFQVRAVRPLIDQ